MNRVTLCFFFIITISMLSCLAQISKKQVHAYKSLDPYTLEGIDPIYDSAMIEFPYVKIINHCDSELIIERVYTEQNKCIVSYNKRNGYWHREIKSGLKIESIVDEFILSNEIRRISSVYASNGHYVIFQVAIFKEDTFHCFHLNKLISDINVDKAIKFTQKELLSNAKQAIKVIFQVQKDSISVSTKWLKNLLESEKYFWDKITPEVLRFPNLYKSKYGWYIFDWHKEDCWGGVRTNYPRYQILY